MELKSLLSLPLKNLSLSLAVLTLLSYIITVIERRIYYSAYGIDANLVGVSFEITSVITVSIILTFSLTTLMLALGWSRILDRDKTKNPALRVKLRLFLIMTMFIASLVATILLFVQAPTPDVIGSRVALAASSGIAGGYTVFMLIASFKKSKKESISILDAYANIITPPNARANIVARAQSGVRIYRAAELMVILIGFIFITLLMTGIVTQSKIQSQANYYYVLGDDHKGSTVDVVIGRAENQYVLKTYDIKREQFLEGFSLSAEEDSRYGVLRIQPVKINFTLLDLTKALF